MRSTKRLDCAAAEDDRHLMTLLALVGIRIRGFCHGFGALSRDPRPHRSPAAIMTRYPFVLRVVETGEGRTIP